MPATYRIKKNCTALSVQVDDWGWAAVWSGSTQGITRSGLLSLHPEGSKWIFIQLFLKNHLTISPLGIPRPKQRPSLGVRITRNVYEHRLKKKAVKSRTRLGPPRAGPKPWNIPNTAQHGRFWKPSRVMMDLANSISAKRRLEEHQW